MATYVLIHGSSANSHYWYLVAPQLAAAGHEVITPDLPTNDASADFSDYADAVVKAIGDHKDDVILVAQSMGAYTAPIVTNRVPTSLIVLVAPMIPAPGETPGAWWSATGQPKVQAEMAERDGFEPGMDMMTTFMHDVPKDVVEDLMQQGEPEQAETIFGQPWPLDRWPDVPTKVLLGRNDRLFPVGMMRRVSEERLGIKPDEIDSGHLVAFGHPDELAGILEKYRAEVL